MMRSKDLDTVAPDDEIISSQPSEEAENKLPNKKDIVESNNKTLLTKNELNQEIYTILGHTKSPFSSFLVRPKVLTFSERDKDEEIYLALRPHWINNLSWMVVASLMFFVPFFFKFFTFLNFFPGKYQFAAVLFWYLITFMYAFQKFLSWYFNLFLVTNQRVVDIDFTNLLNKHFAEADLSAIQDVSSSVRGLLGTFFNFGDILVQTAAEINQINFEKVSNPQKVIKLLKELRNLEQFKNNKGVKHG